MNFTDWNESDIIEHYYADSAEFILKTVYEQAFGLEKIWTDLGESDQLDIAVARGLILDELPANLRQLSLKQGELEQFLRCYYEARSEKGRAERSLSVNTSKADLEIQDALQKMQNLLVDIHRNPDDCFTSDKR